MSLSRRNVLVALTGVALVGPVSRTSAQNMAELAQPGAIGDKVLGSANAPVTIIEYASLTCGHCATFHTETYPKLKAKYIDTGKARLVFREFPTQPVAVALAGFMIARCSGDKYFPLLEVMFEQQQVWGKDPYNGLLRIAKQAGFSEESFKSCLGDQKLLEGIQEITKRAEKFGVESTPTFFINGQKLAGAQPISEFEKVIEPLLKTN